MNKKYNLIELLVVVATVAMIISLIFTKIEDVKEYSKFSKSKADIITIQMTVDSYKTSKHGLYPTDNQPTENIPQAIDFNKIKKYINLRDLETKYKYWINFQGIVYCSLIDAPKNVVFNNITGELSWDIVPNATSYDIYEVTDNSSEGQIKSIKKIVFIENISKSNNRYQGEIGKTYLVGTRDKNGNKTSPVGVGYLGYTEPIGTPEIEEQTSPFTPPIFIPKPIAVINVTPDTEITTTTTLSWSSDSSYDSNGKTITNVEWSNKRDVYPVGGVYTIGLRVQNSDNTWSDWTEKIITVSGVTVKPVAVITMTPDTNITTSTTLTWGYSDSYSPNGKAIIDAQWMDKQDIYTTEGQYTVKLRVQNSDGIWSDWVSIEFTVTKVNNPPVAVISADKNLSSLYSNTSIVWNSSNSYDVDGDTITQTEWQLDSNPVQSTPPNGTYTVGNHTIKLRVQDSKGTWSTTSITNFNVINTAPLVATIDMSPTSGWTRQTVITFSSVYSDPDGHSISAIEWKKDGVSVGATAPNGKYSTGTHTVSVRVQDSLGVWSNWLDKTFIIN